MPGGTTRHSKNLSQQDAKRREVKDNVMQDAQISESDHLARVTQASKKQSARILAVFETTLIGAGLVIMLQLLPFTIFGDGDVRFKALSRMLEQGIMPTMKYSLVGPALSIPFWYLGYVYQTSLWWCQRYNFFVFTIGLLVIYWVLRKWFDRSLVRKFLLILIIASMFPYHLTTYYAEVFTAICVGVGILVATFGSSIAGWTAVILGVVNTPASILGLAFVVIKQILDSKRWRYVLVLAAAVCLLVAEAWIRLGHPLNTGYDNNAGARTVMPYSGFSGFSYPFFFGLLSILFSFGKGLIFFAPGLLLPIRSTILRMQQEKKFELFRVYLLWIAFLLGLILVYSRWWAWYGGWFWGPRFFLFASIPASFALAVRLHYRNTSLLINLLTLIVFCLSMWVGFNGVVFNPNLQGICYTRDYALEFLCHYTPEFSVLWYPFVIQERIKTGLIPYVVYSIIAFAYLAIPLIWKIACQTAELVRISGKAHLNIKTWHF